MGKSSETRGRLVALVALLKAPPELIKQGDADAAWKVGEDWVAAMEAEPERAVQCPCCTKLVRLCLKHYQLHEPGKLCSVCREEP
jgi:hypothetical protein